MTAPELPPEWLASRTEALTRKHAKAWRRADGGYTQAERWVARFEDGTSCFVKAGATPGTAQALRSEYAFYSQVQAPYLPRLLGWQDHPEHPLLLLEDLSHAHWPPPWTSAQIDSVLAALDKLHAVPTAALNFPGVRQWDPNDWPAVLSWPQVERDPRSFLSLRLCSRTWLDMALPVLLEAERAAPLDGDSLVHMDVRSDNVCFDGGRAVILDWNYACLANPDLDLSAWLPSLEAEGGPPCEALLPDAGPLASLVAGYFAARAGIFVPGRERLQEIRLFQLRPSLRWAARALGLPPPDGRNAH